LTQRSIVLLPEPESADDGDDLALLDSERHAGKHRVHSVALDYIPELKRAT